MLAVTFKRPMVSKPTHRLVKRQPPDLGNLDSLDFPWKKALVFYFQPWMVSTLTSCDSGPRKKDELVYSGWGMKKNKRTKKKLKKIKHLICEYILTKVLANMLGHHSLCTQSFQKMSIPSWKAAHFVCVFPSFSHGTIGWLVEKMRKSYPP